MIGGSDIAKVSKIHLLDVGQKEYGDAVLCEFGNRRVLIDGAHRGDENGSQGHLSIPDQIGQLLNELEPYSIDLLLITHAHDDHIGCIPSMVTDNVLRVKWALVMDPDLGWGRTGQDDLDANADPRALALAAAFREEIPTRTEISDKELTSFITDAITIETKYRRMIEDLTASGTKVVRFGVDDLDSIIEEFNDIGFRIIGPSQDHLLICAEIIRKRTQDSIDAVTDFFSADSEATSLGAAYKKLIGIEGPDAGMGLDAKSRPGPAINMQSMITRFAFGGHKFLFAGDFQFADPEFTNNDIAKSVIAMRKAIRNQAPFSFVKLSHHGSDNAFSAEILSDLKTTKYLGICAGEESKKHPERSILELLHKNRDTLTWARTDHNGLVTLTYSQGSPDPEITLAKGKISDPKPNDTDAPPSAGTKTPAVQPNPQTGAPIAPERPRPTQNRESASAPPNNFVEFTARIPTTGARIKFSGDFTLDVNSENRDGDRRTPDRADPADKPIVIGGNRSAIRDLLFITSHDQLRDNIGRSEADSVIAALERQGLPNYTEVPSGLSDSSAVIPHVSEAFRRFPNVKGVVVIGGYDVMPSKIVDALPIELRSALPSNDDPDNFIVWNDEFYGDNDDDQLPEIPVSRVPDGRSAPLLIKALSASPSAPLGSRFGIRNFQRPFAENIFDALTGNGNLLISKQTVFDQDPPYTASADKAYFMLHGDYVDGSRFWGEGTQMNREAFNVNNVPSEFSGVVFTGCCWGALTVNTPAGLVRTSRAFGQKTTDSSIALSFLAHGANAFIGCTGAHYSPTEEPYGYFGGPMHADFWKHLEAGSSPAEALFKAKVDYVLGMPHGRTSPLQIAIEYKILRQYTCLGLGW